MWAALLRNAREEMFAITLLLALPSYLTGSSVVPPSPPASQPARIDIASLPDAPEKAIILEHCDVCHGLDWIARSGGTEAGWTDRLRRMIRSGATITPEQIPALAAYLAKVLPTRPAPPEDR